MNWIDYAIIGIIGLSVVVSLMRGFIKECLSLTTWVAAFWFGLTFHEQLSEGLEPWIGVPSARLVVAFVIIFVCVLIVGAIINSIISGLVKKTGLSGTDRVIGILFGFARGVVVIGLLVLSAGLTALPQDPWWNEATLLVHFQELALWMREFLPLDLAENIRYD